jgi:hypothetical protein
VAPSLPNSESRSLYKEWQSAIQLVIWTKNQIKEHFN